MTSSSLQSEVFAIRPPTPAEVDQLATISAISFILGFFAFICIVGAALTVALKTQLPGRWAVFLSGVLLFGWWALVQFMGGDLEMTFGPVALLVTYAVYSAIALVFALGYLRMSFAVLKQSATQAANNEA
jgi:predicted acyltransferase